MTRRVEILVGSMTGAADLAADALADGLRARGFDPQVAQMDGLGVDAFQPGGLYVICSSTYGQGDVPDNARGLYEALRADGAGAAQDWSQVGYAVFSMGDSTYADTFCRGGMLFDEALAGLGARRVAEICRHDASEGTMPEDTAEDWGKGPLADALEAE